MNVSKFGLLCWLLCLLILCQPLLVYPTQTPEGPLPGEDSVAALLQAGKEAYLGLDYEKGIELLRHCLTRKNLLPEQRRDACLYQGLCLASLGKSEQALKAFLQLLELYPDFQLDKNLYSPKILSILDKARQEYRKRLRIKDNLPPTLDIQAIKQPVPYREQVFLRVRALDDQRVEAVQLFCRKQGEATYTFLPMVEEGNSFYTTLVPAAMVSHEGLEYYMLAIDSAGNATLKGNAAFPLQISVEPGPEDKPWYKKWWIWAIVGATAGAGTALGITLSGGDDTRSSGGTATVRINLE